VRQVAGPTTASASRSLSGTRRWLTTAGPSLVVFLLELPSAGQVPGLLPHLLLALAASLPLIWRHRAPWTVLGITAAVAAVHVLLGSPQTNTILGQWVATAAVVRVVAWPVSLLVPVGAVLLTTGVSLVASPAGGGPDLLINVISALVAWAFGDAQARRDAARTRMAAEIEALQASSDLRSRYEALTERLRISDETGRLLGSTLDAVLTQARAGRARLPTGGAGPHLTAVEEEGRRALTHLDRYLELLRVPQEDLPVLLPREVSLAAPGQWGSTRLARFAVSIGPVALLLPLALWEYPGLAPAGASTVTVVLTVLQIAPLAARWRWPLAVTLVVGAALVLQLLLGHPLFNATIALPVALHALASTFPRGRTTLVAVGTAGALAVAALGVGPAYAAGFVTVLVVVCAVAVYIGESARLLREQDEQLHVRLLRSELDDQLRRRAAVGQERLAAAQDLHDSVGHVLSLVTLQAGAARMSAATSPRRAQEALDAIERACMTALAELDQPRRAAPGDDDSPRVWTLEDLREVAEQVRAAGVSVVLRLDRTVADLPPLLETTAFRIGQEALTNVVKHAPGSAAIATVAVTSAGVELTVANTAGRTAAPGDLPSGRRGLHGMRERVSLFGGELLAGPQPGGGFRVHVALPVAGIPRQRAALEAHRDAADR
jgi:signal transduction histidine kinase